MGRKIKQFRFYGDGNDDNYPQNLTKKDLTTGKVFEDYLPIIKLGIQSMPGTEFYLNDLENSIILGRSGIFEFDIDDIEINYLSFNSTSINKIATQDYGYLVIDILYEDLGG